MMINGDKKIVGFTAGNFDILHPGYIYTFQFAKKHCDYFMVFLQNEEELRNLIEFFKPDIRVLGEDYIGKRFTGDDLPPKIIYTSRAHGWSTTKLKNDVTIQTMKQNPEILLAHPDILEKVKQLKYDGDE